MPESSVIDNFAGGGAAPVPASKPRSDITGRMLCQGGAKALRAADLPGHGHCAQCDETKPREQMLVVHTKADGVYYMRPLCKDCHNKKERGHRRGWKTKYLQRWRRKNAKLDKSYRNTDTWREAARLRMATHVAEHHDGIAIQRRLRSRGVKVSLREAEELLAQFGRCYPTRLGLTKDGLRECERIRSKMRKRNRMKLTAFDIRVMVYEDGLFISPAKQPEPYKLAAENLRRWHRSRRDGLLAKAPPQIAEALVRANYVNQRAEAAS
jgi:hypothetical protein